MREEQHCGESPPAIIAIAATGLGVFAAVALAAKPTATIGIDVCSTVIASYQWSEFPAARQAGVTITDLNAGTTTATTQGAGSSGDIRFGIPDVGHFYRARGELRNAGGVALHLSEKTSGVLGNSC